MIPQNFEEMKWRVIYSVLGWLLARMGIVDFPVLNGIVN